MDEASVARSADVGALMVGTTHFVNALVRRRDLAADWGSSASACPLVLKHSPVLRLAELIWSRGSTGATA